MVFYFKGQTNHKKFTASRSVFVNKNVLIFKANKNSLDDKIFCLYKSKTHSNECLADGSICSVSVRNLYLILV